MGALHKAVEMKKQAIIKELQALDDTEAYDLPLECWTLSEIEKIDQECQEQLKND